MDILSALPTMDAEKLIDEADGFAEDLAKKLEEFNGRHPRPKMNREAEKYLKKEIGETVPGPTPKEFIPFFKVVFCRYVASRQAIVPTK